MTDRFLALDFPMQLFWGIAIVTSVFFVIQTIMAFLGLDADTEDGSGFDTVEMEGLSGYFSRKPHHQALYRQYISPLTARHTTC